MNTEGSQFCSGIEEGGGEGEGGEGRGEGGEGEGRGEEKREKDVFRE